MGKNTQRQKTIHGGSKYLREFSSGGVVFKKAGNGVLWLVAASVPSQLFPKISWRFPKGWIDDESEGVPGPMASGAVKADEDSLQKAATREVEEEGGVKARILQKIGTEKYSYTHPARGKILKFVTFYLMEYVKDMPEGHDFETSEVVWLPFSEALKKLTSSGEKEMLKKANDLLAPVA